VGQSLAGMVGGTQREVNGQRSQAVPNLFETVEKVPEMPVSPRHTIRKLLILRPK